MTYVAPACPLATSCKLPSGCKLMSWNCAGCVGMMESSALELVTDPATFVAMTE